MYKSNYRLDRDKLLEYNRVLVEIFDYILFCEKTHLKRGCGFTTITPKFLASKKDENCKKLVLNSIIKCIIQYFKDEYKLVEGVLFRKFPIFPADTTIKEPTNKMRQLMYRVVQGERNSWKFKMFKQFELDAN